MIKEAHFKSWSAFSLPDVGKTGELLRYRIEQEVIPQLQDGQSHLVVADKQLCIIDLLSPTGANRIGHSVHIPQTRRAGKLRDRWTKGPGFGLLYMVQGEADLLLSRRVVTCYTGNFVFLLPQTWRNRGLCSHWERPHLEQSSSEVLWIFFSQDGMFIHLCKSHGAEHVVSPVLYIPDRGAFALIELFGEEVLSSEVTDKASKSATQILWLIFDRALRKLQNNNVLPPEDFAPAQPSLPSQSIGERAQHYIEVNLGEKLTLPLVARAVYVSRTKLVREFTNHTGESFGAYLLRRRLERAQQLLKTTNLQISDIARMCGFSSPYYFSTVFRQHTGLTPTHFRNLQKKDDNEFL